MGTTLMPYSPSPYPRRRSRRKVIASAPSPFGSAVAASASYGSRYERAFESWGDYVTRSEQATGPLGRASRETDSYHSAEWAGTATFEDAVKLARDGWADGAGRLEELTARLEGKLSNVSAVKRIVYSMAGPGVLDMGRYLMGHPEPYMRWADSEELTDVNPDRIVKLLVNAGANSDLSTERIWWRGAAAVAITDLIESSGARVEIELVRKNRSQATHIRRILVKRAQDHISLEILAFALAHNASHRRIDFSVRETESEPIRRLIGAYSGGGYGTSTDLDTDEINGALYVPYSAPEFSGPESTAQWVVETLGKFGIEVQT